uniref:Uncharacterized protein n=1 Tax=Anopheles merus TaxID=30066 RepID=A0A182VA78_ANOME
MSSRRIAAKKKVTLAANQRFSGSGVLAARWVRPVCRTVSSGIFKVDLQSADSLTNELWMSAQNATEDDRWIDVGAHRLDRQTPSPAQMHFHSTALSVNGMNIFEKDINSDRNINRSPGSNCSTKEKALPS